MIRSVSLVLAGLCVFAAVPTLGWVPTAAIAVTPKPAKLTEAEIRQILDAIQAAAEKRDTDGVMQYMAPDVKIDLTLETSIAAPEQLTLSASEYRQYLQQGFEIIATYSSQVSNLKIQVDPKGDSATATYRLVEETTLKDQPISLTSAGDTTVRFERVQGQILATQIRSTARIEFKQS